MTNKYNIVAIFGKAGSGKDALLSALQNKNPDLVRKISYTTRPPREGEVEGKDYYFLSRDEFLKKKFLEKQSFNGWWYGTSIEELAPAPAINIGIFNINGINQIFDKKNGIGSVIRNTAGTIALFSRTQPMDIEILPIYISCSDKYRLIHQLQRETDPNISEIIRRFQADEKDFKNIPFSYSFVYNNEGMFTDTVYEVSDLINSHKGFFK